MDDRFMKERPVFPLLISMALPMVISMLVNSLYNIVDSYFVARISEDAFAALSLVFPIQNLINAVTIGFGIGVNAVIAYHLGANELERADRAASQGLTLSLIHGLVLAAGCIFLMPRFLPLYSDSETVVDLGVRYATVAFAFAPVISLGMFYEKLFQAVGSMRLTMIAMLCGCVANIILDPMMIYGIGPFPEMGIEGAALATGIGQTLSLVIYLVAYKKRPLRVRVRRKVLRPDGKMARRLYAVGVPATLNLALPSILISALNGILAAFGQAYILALGVYYKLQTFLYLTANGIVQGMRPLIGYNYGAGEHARVKRIYDLVLLMSTAIMVVGTALRTTVVLAMAWGMVFVTRAQRGIRKIEGRSWLFLALSGLATGCSWLCYYRALQDGPASAVAPIDKLSILVTVAFSRLFLGEKLSPRMLLGLGLLTGGTLMTLL